MTGGFIVLLFTIDDRLIDKNKIDDLLFMVILKGRKMILIIRKGKIVLITKQNPKGGPALRGFPIREDADSGVLGYGIGYITLNCECGKSTYDEVLMRTVDTRQIVNKFGVSLDEYDQSLLKLKPKEPWQHRLIRFFGGKPPGDY